jgi:membrane dipeptidase
MGCSREPTNRRQLVLPPLFVIVALLGAGCSQEGPTPQPEEDLTAQAKRLALESVIVDTHIDVPYRMQEEPEDISQPTDGGDFDYPRAVEGGLNAAFMSIYTPADLQETGGSRELADSLIDLVEGFEAQWPDKFSVARSPRDVRNDFEAGRISLPMGMENGAPIGDDLANLAYFYDRGIRYVTLTHGKSNLISDSSYDEERVWEGLSPFGRQVVDEMNRLGIMIDISHVTDEAFYQVLDLTRAPVIASHSSCRSFTGDWERNMSDEMIRRLGENGGVIHINFGSAFLTQEAWEYSEAMWDAVEEYRDEHGLAEDDPAVEAFTEDYRKKHPQVLADVSDVVDHIDHAVELAGIDHVGLGSDFDGVGPSTPTGLKDVSFYPNLIRHLLERGYSDEDIRKILGENTLRVWVEVERIAEEIQAGS